MSPSSHPHPSRQHRTKMLQSVAITSGVGKTHLATSLGHIAVRRRHTVKFLRADQMFRTLKAARLDNSVEVEMRALARVDVLIIDLSRTRDYPDVAGLVCSDRCCLRRSGRAER